MNCRIPKPFGSVISMLISIALLAGGGAVVRFRCVRGGR